MLGVLAAWMVRQTPILERMEKRPGMLYGAAFILGSCMIFTSFWGFGPGSTLFLTIGLTWIGVVYFCFILISVVNKDGIMNKILTNKILRGDRNMFLFNIFIPFDIPWIVSCLYFESEPTE